jgi:CubicO group peptidase (beta-lactamase class C family)
VRATEHTLYHLASTSKPVTATGLMVVSEQGKIDLDRPINDYLGEAKLKVRTGDAREATVRRIANHTAGLPHYLHARLTLRGSVLNGWLLARSLWRPGQRIGNSLSYWVELKKRS